MTDFGFRSTYSDISKSEVHAGRLTLDAPAGKHGFLKADGDNFVFEDGTPFKMWGTNLAFLATAQNHQNAVIQADRLAKLGYNCIRIHGWDIPYRTPDIINNVTGLFANGASVKDFDPVAIDKFDYSFYQLKKRGIYISLCTQTHSFLGMSDVDKANMPSNAKIVPYFDSIVEVHYKEIIQTIMTHVNPYTGLAYKDDPAVVIVELANENGVIAAYCRGVLNNGTTINGSYATKINDLWHQWLTNKYNATNRIATSWNYQQAGQNMFKNPTYANNFQGCLFTAWTPAVSTLSYDNVESAAKISTTFVSTGSGLQTYNVRFGQQYDLPLVAGKRYELKFDLKASQAFNVNMILAYNSAIAGSYGNFLDYEGSNGFGTVAMTTNWTSYSIKFKCLETVVNNNIIFYFALGKFLGDTWIKNMVFQTVEIFGLDSNETLENKNILRQPLGTYYDTHSIERLEDTVKFYYELEDSFNIRMIDYAKNTIGVKQLLTVNNWRNGGNVGTGAYNRGDVMDLHYYWDHPAYPNNDWSATNFTQINTSIISASDIPMELTTQAIKGKPYILSEVEAPYPTDYQWEFFPLLTAYSCLQNVQGIFDYDFAHIDFSTETSRSITYFFGAYFSPLQSIYSIIYSIVFTKGYIKQANVEVVLDYTLQYTMRTYNRFFSYWNYGLNPVGGLDVPFSVAATHKVRKRYLPDGNSITDVADVLPSEMPTLRTQKIHVSDTNEIIWDKTTANTSYLKVNAPKFQSLTGRIATRTLSTDNLSINVDIDASISLLSLDDKIISDSNKLLLSLITANYNTGQVKTPVTGNMPDWGTYPVMFKKVSGIVTITLNDASNYSVYLLDSSGNRQNKVQIVKTANTITIDTSIFYTPWFLITNK